MTEREATTVAAISLLIQQLGYDAALSVARTACAHASILTPPPVPPELGAFRRWLTADGLRGPETEARPEAEA